MASEFERAFPENAQQAAYWNVDVAAKWVNHQASIDALFEPVTERLIAQTAPARGERVLDVGCGTGATLLALAAAVGAGGRVVGIDLSAPLLGVAERRVAAAGHRQVELWQADAQSRTFTGAPFDLVTSRFGVMFFSEPVRAFTNLRTALRPGGRLGFACWGDAAANPWFQEPLQAAVRRLGPPAPQTPHAPGPFAFADPDHVRSILAGAGFDRIEILPTEISLGTGASVEDQAAFAIHMGPAARLIRERSTEPDAVARQIHAEVTAAFRRFTVDGRLRIPARIALVAARSPEPRTTGRH